MSSRSNTLEKRGGVEPHMLELFIRNLALKIASKHHVPVTIHKVAKLSGEYNYGVVCEPFMYVKDLILVDLFYSVCDRKRMRFSVVDSPSHNSLGQIVLRIEQ